MIRMAWPRPSLRCWIEDAGLKIGRHFAGFALLAVAVLCLPAGAAQLALLQNGFSIRFVRSERVGSLMRLYLSPEADSGYVDVPAEQISNIEADDSPAPELAAPAAPPNQDLHQVVASASSQTSIDPDLIESVIRAESGFNPKAVSRKGAQGLMQLMPATAAELGVKNAFDPEANIQAGSRYLRDLLLLYHSDLARALAAYNAGPQSVSRFNGVPPYRETHIYVARVISDFNRKKLAQAPRHKVARPSSRASQANPPYLMTRDHLSGSDAAHSASGLEH
jgi:soluble lytic murein transglycosylase-like protein